MYFRPDDVQFVFANSFAEVQTPFLPWYLVGGISASNCVAAYRAKGAPDLATSYVNLANPGTNNAAPGVAPTFAAATGWTFNGTTQYLDTGITPIATTSMLVRFSGATLSGNRVIIGVWHTTTRRLYMDINNGSTTRGYVRGTNSRTSAGAAATSGVIGIAGVNTYWNGAVDTAAIADSFLAISGTTYIGALNDIATAGGPNYFTAANVQAVAVYSVVLSAAQMAAVTAEMNTL